MCFLQLAIFYSFRKCCVSVCFLLGEFLFLRQCLNNSSVWPRTHYVAESGLEHTSILLLLYLLPLPIYVPQSLKGHGKTASWTIGPEITKCSKEKRHMQMWEKKILKIFMVHTHLKLTVKHSSLLKLP